jgi:hypothetical protein
VDAARPLSRPPAGRNGRLARLSVGNLAIRRNQAPAKAGIRDDPEEAIMASRVGVIVASIVAGILLAAGAAYGVTAIATTPQTPANQNPYNYGPP